MADREILIRRSVTITVRMPITADPEHEERLLEYERSFDENWQEFTEWFIDVLRDGPNEITAIDIGNSVRSQSASIFDIKAED